MAGRVYYGKSVPVIDAQITNAFEYATCHRLPVVTVVNTGGARMQEGIIRMISKLYTIVTRDTGRGKGFTS